MKKTNFLLKILGIVFYSALLISFCIDFKNSFIYYYFLGVFLISIIMLSIGKLYGQENMNLEKKDIKIGSKIKILSYFQIRKNESENGKVNYTFLIELENKNIVLLIENEQDLKSDKSYMLNSKRNWEEVV